MNKRIRANGEGSIFPYRNGYAAYVWVQTPAGTRNRKYVYGKDRDVVHEKWLELHNKAKAGPIAMRVPTVKSYVTGWLADVVRPNLAPYTYQTYESHTRLYIVPGLGAKRLDRLTVRDVQTWLNDISKTCQCCAQGKDARRPARKQRCCAVGECCADIPSASSVKSIRASLRAALTSAQIDELVSRNVAKLAKLPSGRSRKSSHRPKRSAWESDDARRFLEHARAVDDALYAAWVLILVLGLRKGEVLGMVWDDLDLDAGELRIGLQLQRVGRRLLHRETKTEESESTLPLPDICVTALRRRKREQEATARLAGADWQDTNFVFTTRHGSPIEPRNFNRSFDVRIKHAGVPRITVHDARRTCASLLADLDVHPRVAMQILRHSQIAITMEVYTQVASKQTREALRRLAESLDA